MATTAYSPEPPLDESSAQFYVDLVAALAGLRFAEVGYFYKPRLNTSQAANTHMFAGARQARNYLLEFRFTQELCQAILLNPLFDKVRPNPARLTIRSHKMRSRQSGESGYLRWLAYRLPKAAESAKMRPKEDLARVCIEPC